ncbi:MAG TPA: FAD-binding oxidoreductase [Myxococcales bacterium]|nr:FAD-binding oxidoreductase [Myxococcales bacterium]
MAEQANFVAALKASLRGEVLAPGDGGYEKARAVYNAMIQRRPLAIARCADVADVIACVKAARASGITVAVRGGGHNAGGLGTVEGGLMIDLGMLRGIRVDAQARTVRVEGGATWGDVDHATHPFGLAVPCGFISTTGVGGLTLGGGSGYLTRSAGLTIDNLLAADVVLADGRMVTASRDEHPDLFWALRGGGGNFGIVTSFLFRAHPVSTVVGGPTFWALEQAEDALRAFQELILTAPEELGGFFAFTTVPPVPPFPEALHGRKVSAAIWCFNGKQEAFDRIVKPLVSAVQPLLHAPHELPFPALQSFFDPLYPPGLQWYWRADFFGKLPDAAIREHARLGATLPTGQSTMHLYPLNGAAARVGAGETAYRHREALWSQVIVGVDPSPARADELRNWTVGYYDALHPYSTGGAYVNFMMEEGSDRIRATYGANYERLQLVKKAYDPDNFFRVNQNIPPAR